MKAWLVFERLCNKDMLIGIASSREDADKIVMNHYERNKYDLESIGMIYWKMIETDVDDLRELIGGVQGE